MRSEQPVIFWTLICAVALAPLPFASIYPWSWGLLASVVGALVAAWSLRVFVGAQKAALGLRATWPFIGLLAVAAGWTALQTVSWTPAGWHHPLWESASRALGVTLAGRISVNPDETLGALTRLLAYAGIFWLALQYGRRTMRAEQMFFAIIVAGCAYGVLAQLQIWLGWKSRLGVPGPNDGWSAWGEVADAHPYAAYVSLALICVSSLVLARGAPTPRRLGLRDLARRLVDGTGASWPLLGVWLLLLALASTFRAKDAVSLWVSLGSLVVVALIGKLARPLRLFVFSLASVLVIVGVGAISDLVAPGAASQPEADVGQLQRLHDLTLDAIGDAPMLGTGYGTFEDVFRFYRTGDLPARVLHAPSSLFETILELGLPAAGALFLLFGAFALLTLSGAVRRQRDSAYAAAGFAATLLIASHAAFDYSLQVPALVATYMLLIGAACAQSWSSRREDDEW